ncbi:MAG: hypothetical protein WC631_02440 [Candidatus Paceibacterota bacterium]
MDPENNKPTLIRILLTFIAIVILFSVAYSFRDSLKRFFGVATIFYSVEAERARLPGNNWTVSTTSSAVHYAWGENVGWIDFAPTGGSIYVADDGLWGWVYGENIGWISLNCHNDEQTCTSDEYGVANDGEGRLSGYAWGENVGWIDFGTSTLGSRPYGVTIDSSGDFTGYAYGENVGWISLNSANGGGVDYKVSTNWRHQSDRPQCNNGIDDDSNGITDYSAVGGDPGCSLLTDTIERTPLKSENPDELAPVITVYDPTGGDQWTTGNDYNINWEPISTSTDTFVYLINGGYGEEYAQPIGFGSSTVANLKHFASDADLPKVLGASWKIAVCSGKYDPSNTANCGFSGVVYINSGGKKVDPKPSIPFIATTTESPNIPVPLAPINTVSLPVTIPQSLRLPDLPVFSGKGKGAFTFIPQITTFLFSPLPEPLKSTLDKFPKLKDYLASVGISREQDLVSIGINPKSLPMPQGIPPEGLFILTTGSTTLRATLSSDSNRKLYENFRIASGTPVTISLVPTKKGEVTAVWNDKIIKFTQDGPYVRANFVSGVPGRNIITTSASPLTLIIEVKAPVLRQTTPTVTPWLSRVRGWFGL